MAATLGSTLSGVNAKGVKIVDRLPALELEPDFGAALTVRRTRRAGSFGFETLMCKPCNAKSP